MRPIEIPASLANALLARLRSDRDLLAARLAEHEAQCAANAPHGYITCQLQHTRLEREIARADAEISALAAAIRGALN